MTAYITFTDDTGTSRQLTVHTCGVSGNYDSGSISINLGDKGIRLAKNSAVVFTIVAGNAACMIMGYTGSDRSR